MGKTWVKRRHKYATAFVRIFLGPFTAMRYRVKVIKFKEADNRQFLVLFNHQTAFDQFFLGMAFKNAIYYLASEDIFSIGFISKVLRYLTGPIPIKKQMTDLQALKNCLTVAKEGGTIAIAPEGQRTYSGETTYINPAIGAMAKKLKLPIAIFMIDGGYGVQPRWSNVVRRGRMKAGVTRVIEPEEYENLSKEELAELIKKEMSHSEACYDGEYRHKKLAEHLERVFYYCPDCGLSVFESKNDIISCKSCGNKIRYGIDKRLSGVDKPFPYEYVLDWYKAQEKHLNSVDITRFTQEPVFTDTVNFLRVVINKRKEVIKKGVKIALYGNRIELTGEDEFKDVFSFDNIRGVTVVGNNKSNLYRDGDVYQIKGGKDLNALKYVHFYHRYKNLSEGNADVEFLGL